MSEDVSAYGFDAQPDDVAEICANIMFQIINLRAEGKDDEVTTLTYRRKETGKRIKISPLRQLNAEATNSIFVAKRLLSGRKSIQTMKEKVLGVSKQYAMHMLKL